MTLSFSEEDAQGVMQPHDDPIVVTVTVANHMIHRILVDNGRSADVLYWPVFKQMGSDRDRITPFSSPLVGFTGEQVQPIGLISLPFPTKERVGKVKGDQTQARRYYNTSLKRVSNPTPIVIGTVGDNNKKDPKGEPAEPLENEVVSEDKTLKIGTQLSPRIRDDLIIFLRGNLEVFAWTHENMPGIDPEDILHQLNVDPSVKPVKQKRRKFALERNVAIAEEVEKLLKARFIEEVYYPDCFPLPRIDALMDSTAGYGLLSFMDAFSGYNQIYMHPEDREKTAFITDRGLYGYKVMPFGLKNAGQHTRGW
ncbi:uncharacterized protein LOC132174156 [Corylus avellana]|uniref:uncharacterized protein LOC132174156 n=1 Tax=Corylus avellana TaxID=13451 RepID=UPI00286BA11B|nr:uncharacterized protein LOC132174156 [Corylus avellana]